MADRLTQLQDQVNILAERFSTYTGVLQRDAPATALEDGASLHVRPPPNGAAPPPQTTETIVAAAVDMAQNVADNVRVIDELIDSLPGIKSTKPEQLATLNKLEAENQQLTQELRHTLDVSAASLALVREALHEIYMDRLQSQGISLPN